MSAALKYQATEYFKLAFMSTANTTIAKGMKLPAQTRAAKPAAAPISAPIVSKMPGT